MCGWVVEEGRGCLEEDSRPECDMLARRVSFSVSCKARESPVRRTSLQEEVGVDGWIGKKEASALKKKKNSTESVWHYVNSKPSPEPLFVLGIPYF